MPEAGRHSRSVLLLLLACAAGLAAVRPAAAQVVRGGVADAADGTPVAGATVTLLDSSGGALLYAETDSAGAFELGLPAAGEYALRVERLGYADFQSQPLAVAAGERVEVEVRLGAEALPLAGLTVVGRRTEARSPFYERLERGERTGLGLFLTREELEQAATLNLGSVLARVPRIPIVYDGAGKARLGRAHRGGVGSVDGYVVRPAETCASELYLNGVRVPALRDMPLDEVLGPEQLEGIEIYRSSPEVPAEYARPGTCVVVALWSRVTGEAGRGGWVRTVIGSGAVLGLASLLLFD